jgi:hypothetical protein
MKTTCNVREKNNHVLIPVKKKKFTCQYPLPPSSPFLPPSSAYLFLPLLQFFKGKEERKKELLEEEGRGRKQGGRKDQGGNMD